MIEQETKEKVAQYFRLKSLNVSKYPQSMIGAKDGTDISLIWLADIPLLRALTRSGSRIEPN
jgi:hypothetical protein